MCRGCSARAVCAPAFGRLPKIAYCPFAHSFCPPNPRRKFSHRDLPRRLEVSGDFSSFAFSNRAVISAGFPGSYSLARLRLFHLVKTAATDGMYGIVTGVALPTSNRDVDKERIKVHSEAAPPGPFCGDQSRSAPQKWIEHDFTA